MPTSDDEEDEAKANVDVLERRYEELIDAHSSQKESWEKEGEHSRRMFRLVLVLLGIVVTALSTGRFEPLNTAIFSDPRCALFSGPECLYTNHLLFIGIMSLLASIFFYVKGASGGLLIGAPPSEYADKGYQKDSRELSEFENETDYLKQRIEEMEDGLTHGYNSHLSKKI